VTTNAPVLHGRGYVSAWLDDEILDALTAVARRNGRSRSEELRRAIARHILREARIVGPPARARR
jgi:predicted transcriptional regulator